MKILDQKMLDEAIVVALGSNVASEYGAPERLLGRAMDALDKNDVKLLARSRLWRSRAWPDPAGPEYLNAVCVVETPFAPNPLMARLHAIEADFGRVRTEPNAPRTLDLDLIAYGRRIQDEDPILPHPRASQRRFVMGPLADIAPGWRHPLTGELAQDLAHDATIGQDATPLG